MDQPGVRFGIATGALVLTLLLVAGLPLGLDGTAVVAVLVAAAAGSALPWSLALALGAETWAFFTGFFENRYGVLTLTDHDLLRLAGFVVATTALAHLFRGPHRVASRGAWR